ncbi:hypothetical protein HanRHA438_Chr06g0252331 [Helianthus annuus]|uniref:Uncharacterized protein n=1 Tax=Helianthus annuus TaxID=4232 RepID=A0A9K3NIP6_HELAN|nr:uncharacterized protein LOC118479491 [Helianthus annuus]KAF5801023.1 hypothetical protein HanXRQr2_Chr06g0243331 [Helianthus annuus]KAJ0565329.1 hypothetical protein HanIR_Chr06g0261431 [Helianthus annuus]KAJ0572327.1 hypothetical protein HanHA89_Chr06g0214531 [Helianthus annuus]KAJ0910441.1 hypothetical protein HanRHA438_Chr06g0252331 [Helianthus annuus]
MTRITARVYQGVKGYWRRRRYKRLGGKSQRRFWRIRITRKLKLKLRFSPKKLLIRIRDAYVNMMMRMANSSLVAGTGGYGEAKFGMKPGVKYDEKVIIELYKSLVMRQSQLVPIDAPQIAISR